MSHRESVRKSLRKSRRQFLKESLRERLRESPLGTLFGNILRFFPRLKGYLRDFLQWRPRKLQFRRATPAQISTPYDGICTNFKSAGPLRDFLKDFVRDFLNDSLQDFLSEFLKNSLTASLRVLRIC